MSKDVKRPYAQALPLAQEVVGKLRPYCHRIEIAGSLRRQRPEVGDLEIVAIPKYQVGLLGPDYKQPSALDLFFEGHEVPLIIGGKMYKKGQRERQKRFRYRGYQVDLFLAVPENWGLIYWLRTGSEPFGKWCVTLKGWGGAMPPGMQSKDGFLWRNGEQINTPEEVDFFNELGLPFIPVEMRDNGRWHEFLETVQQGGFDERI